MGKKSKGVQESGGVAVAEPEVAGDRPLGHPVMGHSEATFEPELRIVDIEPSPRNNRRFRDDAQFREMVASIRELGVLEPIIVRPVYKNDGADFEIVCGETRWRAAREAGRTTIPALVSPMDEATALVVMVTENMVRKDLRPLEEARGVRALLEAGDNIEEVAARIGKSRKWVARRASLTDLIEDWQKLLNDPESPWFDASIRCIELVARLPEETQASALELAKRVLKDPYGRKDMIISNPNAMSDLLDDIQRKMTSAPFNPKDETLVPQAGSCLACPKRSACKLDLFELENPSELSPKGFAKDDRCLDAACYERKVAEYLKQKAEKIKAEGISVVVMPAQYWDHAELKKKFEGDAASEPLAELVTGFYPHNFDKAKKGDDGAFAVLVGSGSQAGKVEYFKSPKGRTSKGTPQTEEKKPPTIKERIERIHQLRLGKLADHLIELISPSRGTADIEVVPDVTDLDILESKIRVPLVDVIPLVFAFGVTRKNDYPGGSLPSQKTLVATFASNSKDPHGAIHDLRSVSDVLAVSLVTQVCEILASRIGLARRGCKNLVESEVRGACKVLYLDFDRLFARIEDANPFPKSWRAEAEKYLAKKNATPPEKAPAGTKEPRSKQAAGKKASEVEK